MGSPHRRREIVVRKPGSEILTQEAHLRPSAPSLPISWIANHILMYDQGVVDGFGHVSVRSDCAQGLFLPGPATWRRRWCRPMTFLGIRSRILFPSTPPAAAPIWSASSTAKFYRARPDVMAGPQPLRRRDSVHGFRRAIAAGVPYGRLPARHQEVRHPPNHRAHDRHADSRSRSGTLAGDGSRQLTGGADAHMATA